MTDITHPLSRALAAHPRPLSNPISRAANAVAGHVDRLVQLAASAGRARRARLVLAGLSQEQRRDIGLSDRVTARESGLGDINQARGFALRHQLGWPYGR